MTDDVWGVGAYFKDSAGNYRNAYEGLIEIETLIFRNA